MMTYLTGAKTFLGMAALLIAADTFSAEADPGNASSQRCIEIKNIRRTEVIDDQNILFHLSNKKIYNNHLPQRCIGLAAAKAFQYETSLSELCNVDIIRVLSSTTGTLVPGAACGLGLFEPVAAKAKTDQH